jgi:2-methylisocitrate lyase-like PEP mutase family enzyme
VAEDARWRERAETFRRLHDGPGALRLVNAWDRLSARVFVLAGAPAIGTSSFAVALANGYADGENIPWELVREVVASIVGAVEVPVSVDIEAGQGEAPDAVALAVADVVAAGAVGINLEDRLSTARGGLFGVEAQSARIAAARDAGGRELFINARCDVWFGADIADDDRLDEAMDRARGYVEAGADGLFFPGLVSLDTLHAVAAKLAPTPVNAMLWPGLPSIEQLEAAGVRRLSQGGSAFLVAAAELEAMTRRFLEGAPELFGAETVPAFHLVPSLAAASAPAQAT